MIAIFFLNLPMNDHHFGCNKKKHLTKTLVPSVKTAHQFVLSTIPSVKGVDVNLGALFTLKRKSHRREFATPWN
jgi:hypothetical protein